MFSPVKSHNVVSFAPLVERFSLRLLTHRFRVEEFSVLQLDVRRITRNRLVPFSRDIFSESLVTPRIVQVNIIVLSFMV